MIRHFTLPPVEAHRALEAGGPLQDLGIAPDRLQEMSIAVVEVDDLIVAYWAVWYGLHVEPLFVAEAYRKHPAVISGIVEEMQTIVEASGEPAVFCVIEEANAAAVAPYAGRLGFHAAPGSLYYLVVSPVLEPVGG